MSGEFIKENTGGVIAQNAGISRLFNKNIPLPGIISDSANITSAKALRANVLCALFFSPKGGKVQ